MNSAHDSTYIVSEEDLENIYDMHVEKLYRFFYRKVLDKTISEDLTSETFLNFVKSVKQNKQMQNPVCFLYGIARNIFLKFLKRKYHYKDFVSIGIDENKFESYIDNFTSEYEQTTTIEEHLLKFLPKVPQKQRDILHKRFIEKMSLKEIAAFLGKNMNYVKTTQKRGIKSLRKLIACTP